MVLARTSTSGERPARLSLSIYLNLDRGEPRFRYMESNRIKRDHLRVVISLERFKRYSLRWHKYICNFIPITLCWLNVESNLIFFLFLHNYRYKINTRVYHACLHSFIALIAIHLYVKWIIAYADNVLILNVWIRTCGELWLLKWVEETRWWTLKPSTSSHKACTFFLSFGCEDEEQNLLRGIEQIHPRALIKPDEYFRTMAVLEERSTGLGASTFSKIMNR